jgi:hypothetical protein
MAGMQSPLALRRCRWIYVVDTFFDLVRCGEAGNLLLSPVKPINRTFQLLTLSSSPQTFELKRQLLLCLPSPRCVAIASMSPCCLLISPPSLIGAEYKTSFMSLSLSIFPCSKELESRKKLLRLPNPLGSSFNENLENGERILKENP